MPVIRKVIKPGVRFGRLVVVRYMGRNLKYVPMWYVLCDCGQEREVSVYNLQAGRTTSCGCYAAERSSIHRETGSLLYVSWRSIKTRCYNTSHKYYADYGGRGIELYAPWHDYQTFANDIRNEIGDRPGKLYSIDRLDNSGHYEPGNVRWATAAQQSSNQRTRITAIRLEHEGRSLTIEQWAQETGIPYHKIYERVYKQNWTVRAALSDYLIEYR